MKALVYFLFDSVLLYLSILGQLGKFINFLSLFKIFSSELDGLQRGQIIGSVIFWILLIVAIYYLFKYASKPFIE